MVLVQNWPIFNFSSLVNLGEENVSYDILNEQKKKTLLRYKKKGSRTSEEIEFFPKPWLVHGFGPKLADFPSLFIGQSTPGKCVS